MLKQRSLAQDLAGVLGIMVLFLVFGTVFFARRPSVSWEEAAVTAVVMFVILGALICHEILVKHGRVSWTGFLVGREERVARRNGTIVIFLAAGAGLLARYVATTLWL